MAETGFISIANHIGYKVQTLEEAVCYLNNVKESWLLVLDNADDPEVEYDRLYFPLGQSSTIILTSRNAKFGDRYTNGGRPSDLRHIELETLTSTEAEELLLKISKVGQDEVSRKHASAIASHLSCHALALIQAGTYISRGYCELPGYLEVFRKQRKRSLGFKSEYGNVYTTFEMSARRLQGLKDESGDDALQLLSILGNYGPNQLPVSVFESAWLNAVAARDVESTNLQNDFQLSSWHVDRLPSFVRDILDMDEWDSFRLLQSVNRLEEASLISFDRLHISMHPLVHAWARDRLNAEQQDQSWLAAGCLIAFAVADHNESTHSSRMIMTHIQTYVSLKINETDLSSKTEIASIVLNCACWLNYHYFPDNAKSTVSALLGYLNLDESRVDCTYLPIYVTLGHAYSYSEDHRAEELLQQIIPIQKQIYGEDHQEVLSSKLALSDVYIDRGETKQAIELLEKATESTERLSGYDETWLLSQYLLALAYRDDNQTKRAIELFEKITQIEEKILPEDNLDRLLSQQALAVAYRKNNQMNQAIELLEKVTKIQERLPEDNLVRLDSQQELAVTYRHNNQKKEAIELLEKISQIEEEILPEDHQRRLHSQYQLAITYRLNNQTKQAIELLEKVTKIQERFSEVCRDRHDWLYQLALAYHKNDQIKQAIELFEKVTKIRESIFPEDCQKRLLSQYTLAVAYSENDQIQQAIELLEKVTKIQEKTLLEDNRDRLNSQYQLSIAYYRNNQTEQAMELFEKVTEIRERILPEDYQELLSS